MLKPFFCLCRFLGYNSRHFAQSKAGFYWSHLLRSVHFLQLLSLLVPQFTAGVFSSLVERGGSAKAEGWQEEHTPRHCSTPGHLGRRKQKSCTLSRKPPKAGQQAGVVAGKRWKHWKCSAGVIAARDAPCPPAVCLGPCKMGS